MFHGGNRPIDIYRRIYAGINGTSMPSFALQFKDNPEMFWHLVNYIERLADQRRRELISEEATFRRPTGESDAVTNKSMIP